LSVIKLKNKLKYSRHTYDDEGYVIHMLTSNERTFFTNAYIIETKNALVVVDTMMINSDAILLRQHIDNINKPLIAVIITHGHPDHYNGTELIITGFSDVPVISTKGTLDCIKDTIDSKEVKWKPYFGQDWPEHKTLPNQLVKDGEVVSLDGLDYTFRDLHAAESSSDLLFTLGGNKSVVFVGDVVFNKMHGFMNDGNSARWLKVLQQLLTELGGVKRLFTGHGDPGNTVQLVEEQIDYIDHYRAKLWTMISDKQLLSEAQKRSFEQLMINNYPKYQLTCFIKAGIEAVAQELIAEQFCAKGDLTSVEKLHNYSVKF
jgi:glyoxylase-like metal-dependent hydrolase (beta-lactamase superfamily II)